MPLSLSLSLKWAMPLGCSPTSAVALVIWSRSGNFWRSLNWSGSDLILDHIETPWSWSKISFPWSAQIWYRSNTFLQPWYGFEFEMRSGSNWPSGNPIFLIRKGAPRRGQIAGTWDWSNPRVCEIFQLTRISGHGQVIICSSVSSSHDGDGEATLPTARPVPRTVRTPSSSPSPPPAPRVPQTPPSPPCSGLTLSWAQV